MKLTVIGAGPGGYEAAIYAAKRGAEVTLIEKDRLGGTCLNRGCIPTKAFLACADVLESVGHAGDFGIRLSGAPEIDYPAIVARKNKVMDSLVKGVAHLMKDNGVRHITGTATLLDAHTASVSLPDGTEERVESDAFLLATGSVPLCPPAFRVDRKRVITSDEVLELPEAPASMLIVGGGVIGCEIGQFLSRMGTQVTIVEALPRLMATMDEDVSKQLARQFKKEKIKVVTGDGIAQVEPGEDDVTVTLSSGRQLTAQYVLVAIGRAPYTEGLGLEKVGVRLDERGRVEVNEWLQTSVENIYAIGDLLSSAQLAHVASKEGFVAVDNLLGARHTVPYHAVPGCVFTTPELASVGTLEWQLQKEGKAYRVGSFDFRALGKAQASGQLAGFVKVITDEQDVLIGAEIVGAHASDMLQVLTTAVQLGLKAEALAQCIFPHPTMCEAILEALEDLHGMSIHKVRAPAL